MAVSVQGGGGSGSQGIQGVLTYEHDYYVDITRQYREKSRKYLQSLGHELVVGNVSVEGVSAFEDWWCYPNLIRPEILNLMKSNKDIISVENYFSGN